MTDKGGRGQPFLRTCYFLSTRGAMIQRIQTVYLVLGALLVAGLGLFERLWSSAAAIQYEWFVPALIGLIVLTVGTALVAIFLYNDRETQRRVVIGVQLLTICLAAVLYGGLYMAQALSFTGVTGILWDKTIMLLLPILAYALFLLARRGIEHDIELVESMDRIR